MKPCSAISGGSHWSPCGFAAISAWRRSLNRAIVPALRSALFPTSSVSPMPKAGDADVELLQLAALLEPIEREWNTQVGREGCDKGRVSGDTDCDWDDLCDRIATICNDILSRKATTIAGLVVQTRALGLTNGELWHAPRKVEDASERISSYFRSVSNVLGVALPPDIMSRDA